MTNADRQAADLDQRAHDAATIAEGQELAKRADRVRKRGRLSLALPKAFPLLRN